LPASEKFSASGKSISLPATLPSEDAFMKNVWVKKAAEQFNAQGAAIDGRFMRAEDVANMDWVVDGLSLGLYDQSSEKVLLTEEAIESKLRYENANFAAAYNGEYIDGLIRQAIFHARIHTTDNSPSVWIGEAYIRPGSVSRLDILFFTNMFNTILRLGGPTLHFASYKSPNSLKSQSGRKGLGLSQVINNDGSQTFIKTAIGCSDGHIIFAIKNPGGMQETQTSLIVLAE
jgi:hypothetical protein